MRETSEVSQSKIRGGHKAKQSGIEFEDLFFNAARDSGLTVIRLPQGAQARKFFDHSRGRPGIKFVPVKMPFDFILSTPTPIYPTSAFIDTKSISAVNLTHSFLTDHQVQELFALEQCGHVSGYVVHFKITNKVVFFTASLLKNLKPRESLKPDQGKLLGTAQDLDMKELL